jgi:hypothetical protein
VSGDSVTRTVKDLHEDANPAHLLGLLRTCRERPYDGNSNTFGEISPAHVILR